MNDNKYLLDIEVTTCESYPVCVSNATKKIVEEVRISGHSSGGGKFISSLIIKKVIFNNPATIIIWEDGEKTVVKCRENERYDPEKGLSMAIAEKVLGGYGQIKKIVEENYKDPEVPDFICNILAGFGKSLCEAFGGEKNA